MKRTPIFLISTFIISLSLAACNLGVPAPQDPGSVATFAAQTVEAVLATSTAAQSAAETSPTVSPTSSVAIDGTTAEPATCEDTAQINKWEREFVPFDKAEADKPLAPGKTFWISLELQNTSPCLWTHQYRVQYNSGTRLHTGPDTFPFMQTGFTVKPGETFTLSLQLTAPTTPGSYESSYSLLNADGEAFLNFGIPTNVGTPSTGNLPAPGNLRYEYSCVPGTVTITLNWVDKADGEEGYRIYRDGTKLTDLPAGSTTYSDIISSPGSYQYTVAAFNPSGESPTNVQAETTNCQ